MIIPFWQDERGTSMVEVMISVVIFLIIMVGGLNYFLLPQSAIVRQKIRRLAISVAKKRMESLKALQFNQVTTDSNETNTSISLGSIQGFRSTTVTYVDDAADGLGGSDSDSDTIDYKTIDIQLSYAAGAAQPISFTTKITDVSFGSSSSANSSLSTWGRKCELVIQSSQVTADLTDFSVLLTEATFPFEMFDADGSYPALNGGGDIRFTSDSAGSNRLACQIVTFSTDNNPANGEGEIWVKVPSISGSSNTSIWVWYNKGGQSQPAEDETYGSESVWDGNYVLIQHMNKDPSGSAPQMIDATSLDNDGTSNGSMTSFDLIDAKIGKGLDFDGSNDYISVPNASSLQFTSALMIAGWIKADTWPTGDEVAILFRKGGDSPNNYQLSVQGSRATILLDDSDQNGFQGNTILNSGQWYHIAGVWNGSDARIYVNGTLDKSPPDSKSGTLGTDTRAAYIGGRLPGSFHDYFNGKIDEVHVSNSSRSADWITAEYNNQNNPSTFVIEGSPQTP